MQRLFLLACLFVATSVWATQPDDVVRAYIGRTGGYVLVNAQDEIIGMSDSRQATAVSEGMTRLLASMGKTLEVIHEDCPAYILAAEQADATDSVGPLLGGIMFWQREPYNLLTPIEPESQTHCVTGCVATAMAQIMAYHRWPLVCADTVVSYTTSSLALPVSFDYRGCAFDWDNILDTYEGNVLHTPRQDTAVAVLMSACGVAVNMDYSPSGSGAYSPKVPGVFARIFRYKKGLKYQERGTTSFTNSDFIWALKKEFDEGRPVYCSATTGSAGLDSGHAFVLDGYKTANSSRYQSYFIHYNWGWGGNRNDWFKPNDDDNNPYTSRANVIIGIEPDRTTPVDEVEEDALSPITDGRIYDLLGRIVTHPVSGQIYICNGIKFICK